MIQGRLDRLRSLLIIVLFGGGILLSLLSLGAEILALDFTPGFGIVQMVQLMAGLTCLTLAGFLHLHRMRPSGTPRSLQADIGIRLAATGLVFAFVSGFSDLIGIGTHVPPAFERPSIGPLQLGGLILGVLSIAAGLMLYYTSRGHRESSSLESLLPKE